MLKKLNILTLLSVIVPLLLIGASNYFFAASSYHYIIDPETMERTGRYWVGDIDGILMALTVCAIAIAVWLPSCYYGLTEKLAKHIIERTGYYRNYIKDNRRKILRHLTVLFSIMAAAVAVVMVLSGFSISVLSHSIKRVVFFASAGLSVYSIIMLWDKPEKLFFSLSLIIGFMYVLTHPFLFFGMDNEMHYAWAVEESYLLNVSVIDSDLVLAKSFQHNHFGWLPSGSSNAVVYSFPKGSDTLAWANDTELRTFYARITHMHIGFALYVGRSLALPPNFVLMLGMMINHLVYTTVVYFAIKRLNSGKHLMAIIAMLPTVIITSASYGYGAWLAGFFMLGFAYYLNELQNPDKKISIKNAVIMIGAFFLGNAAKPVYFPAMLVLYFIKKNKFKSEKQYRWYLAAVTVTILFIIASFAVPFIISDGAVYEDERAGDGIDSMEQILFILQNPLAYTGILLRYMRDFFDIFVSGWYLSWYGSYWYFSFPNILWLLILFAALTDRNENDRLTSTALQKVLISLIVFSTVALFITAFYISFTQVGADTVAGVQKRYLIPFLFPFFYVVCGFKIENKINKRAYSCFIFSFMSLVLLNGAWNTFIP